MDVREKRGPLIDIRLALGCTCCGLVIVASEDTKEVQAPHIRGAPAGATEGVCLPSAFESRFFEPAPLARRPGLQIHRWNAHDLKHLTRARAL